MAWFGADKISNGELQDLISRGFQQFLPARVVSIDQSENLTNGNIVAEIVSPLATISNQQKITAFPLFANIKTYPLINEVVFLISGPSGDYSSNSGKVKYYYLSTLNIWNSIHVNPTPNPYENTKPNSQNKSISEVEAGSTNKSSESDSISFKPGTYFTEKSNIYPLYPFEGDVIYEGRFGNSIRLGSTDIQYRSQTTETVIDKKFTETYNYPTGESDLPLNFNSKLALINNRVNEFFQKYDNDRISVYIESSESRVTNNNNVPLGGLAKIRAEKARTLVSSFSNLKNNINVTTKIGNTAYRVGVDNPNDPKYSAEQYTSITVLIQGTESESIPTQPTPLNTWSISGSNGDPITILRNGQNPELGSPAQSTTVEEINKDLSSIYLTSTQQLPIEVSSQNDYLSYGEEKPIAPNLYSGAQVVLNSGRLLFNSTQDNIMLSSKKSINLNSIEGINMDTPGPIILESGQVFLGSREAEESVLLGDSTVDLLQNLISDLVSLLNIMGSQIGNNGILLEPMGTTARTISNNLSTYQSQLDSLKSNIVKVE
ncbi:hypothetical protein OAA18_00435 [bacterium]|nr:hypothetical protein [bacterium]